MNRREVVLAALAAGGEDTGYSPVHVQKMFFLIDREAEDLDGRPFFSISPDDYSPFNRAVYEVLDGLEDEGLVAMRKTKSNREYLLTDEGHRIGTAELNKLPEQTAKFFRELTEWVRGLSFRQLVSPIYNKYPDMEEKNVFRS